MIYTKDTIKAMKLEYDMHHGQYDKGGAPYINHPLAVADKMKSEDLTIVALLHDVMEDCGVTREFLLKEGYSDRVVTAIEAITKREGENYDDYIARVRANALARTVKMHDLIHNSFLERLGREVTDEDLERVKRYRRSLGKLL